MAHHCLFRDPVPASIQRGDGDENAGFHQGAGTRCRLRDLINAGRRFISHTEGDGERWMAANEIG